MTNTTMPDEVFKRDVLGRVRPPPERRDALLDEFERSGRTGQKFAALVGVKYQTLASWRHKRRGGRGGEPSQQTDAATTTMADEVIKSDVLGRVRTPREPGGVRDWHRVQRPSRDIDAHS